MSLGSEETGLAVNQALVDQKGLPSHELDQQALDLFGQFERGLKGTPEFTRAVAEEYFKEFPDMRQPMRFSKGGKDWAVLLVPQTGDFGLRRVLEIWRHDQSLPLRYDNGRDIEPGKERPKDFEEHAWVVVPQVGNQVRREGSTSELAYTHKLKNLSGENNALAVGQLDGLLEDLIKAED